MRKIQLLLSLRSGEALDSLEAALASEGRRLLTLLPKGTRHRRFFHLADDPILKVARGSAVSGGPRFDAIFEAGSNHVDLRTLTSGVEGLAARLGRLVDADQSAAIAGEERVILPGEAPLMSVYALRRLPSLTTAQFHDYWLNEHAGTAMEVARGPQVTMERAAPQLRGYCQFHSESAATKAAAKASGLAIDDFEGVAEGFFSDADEVVQVLSQPDVVDVALEDEKKFIDVTRSVLIVTRIASDTI